MKIIDKLNRATTDNRTTWSFEFFPPKTEAGVQNLFDRLDQMYSLGPAFIDVTWGAGGSTSETSLAIAEYAQTVVGLEVCMHLTCTNMSIQLIDEALNRCKDIGIQNILALRGDPPRGQNRWTACEGGFTYAADLVRYIKQKHGDYFCISVAGYPEGHLDNPNIELDLMYLKEKVDAGADYIVTQMFYDVNIFINWVQKCRKIGITCPILPGVMPIQTYGGFQRMTSLCKTSVPEWIRNTLEPIKDDDTKVKQFGIQLAVDMCKQIINHTDIHCVHIYTMNLQRSVRLILEGLEWVAPLETIRPLPWNPSLCKKRQGESVRPIHWRNRMHSYISRTEDWDDYPNFRWGDARSPAFGDISGHGISLKLNKEEALTLWGVPTTLSDICRVFIDYCYGKIKCLPWSDGPIALESNLIMEQLVNVNARGYLTINSQPSINGELSTNPIVGWGPPHGRVYQKAYVEVFIPNYKLDILQDYLNKYDPDAIIQYFAVNRDGQDVRTNVTTDSPTAVTWGIFKGREVLQPTVVDLVSFLAWKDEAFLLWDQWINLVPETNNGILTEIANNWYLVTLVHNDYFTSPDTLLSVLVTISKESDRIYETVAVNDALELLDISYTNHIKNTKQPKNGQYHHEQDDSGVYSQSVIDNNNDTSNQLSNDNNISTTNLTTIAR